MQTESVKPNPALLGRGVRGCSTDCGSLCVESLRANARSERTATMLSRIASYPFAQVREKLLAQGKLPSEVVDVAIGEFRKYLSLIALGHKRIGMNSRAVDEVWHTFILFTRDYMSFCNEVFGHYLHHTPSLPSQPMGPEPGANFLAAYRKEFGEPPDIWLDPEIKGIKSTPTDGCCGEDCAPEPSCSDEPDPKAH